MRARHRHLNPGSAGAVLALDSRFISGLSDGDPVSTWSDRSGQGNDATQSSTLRPTYETAEQGGNPVVRFDGTDDFLESTTTVQSQPLSVILVWKERTDEFFDLPFYSTGSTNGVVLGSVNNSTEFYAGVSLRGGAITPGVFNIFTGNADAANSNSWLNGVQSANGNAGSQGINGVRLCSNYGSEFPPDDLASVTVTSSSLSNPLRRRLEHAAAFSFKIPCS